jgi:hypothetical protein
MFLSPLEFGNWRHGLALEGPRTNADTDGLTRVQEREIRAQSALAGILKDQAFENWPGAVEQKQTDFEI